jgi:hypothetical protein
MKVVPGEDWDVSHEIPLEAGGKDDDTNWLVAHRKCHRTHTSKVDIPLIAKVKRIHQKHIGAKRPKSQMPGSKNSMWKKKMDGSVIPYVEMVTLALAPSAGKIAHLISIQ